MNRSERETRQREWKQTTKVAAAPPLAAILGGDVLVCGGKESVVRDEQGNRVDRVSNQG